jgi:hypothetical protein
MSGENNQDKKGFSGLSDLVSKVDLSDEPQKRTNKIASSPPQPPQATPSQQKDAPPKSQAPSANSTSPIEAVPSGSGSAGKSVLVGIGACFVLWLAVNGGQSNRTYSPPPAQKTQSYSAPQSSPAPAVAPTPPRVPQSSGLQYTKPSVGTNNLLSRPEIQWCIRESIRIDAMRNLIDTNAGIDAFNRIVNDYNSRCGSYRYREGTLSQAERSVAPYLSQIVAEAAREAKQLGNSYQPSSPSVSSIPSTSSAPEKPNSQQIKEAQQLLTNLGYAPGPIDGQYGRRTADAVKAFQQKVGLPQNGQIDQNFLSILRSTTSQRPVNIEGKYEYADTTSMQGGFTIKKEGSSYTIALHMVSVQAMRLCTFEGQGKLEGDVLNFDASHDQRKAMLRIVFSGAGAELEDIGGAHMNWCGLRAWMAGKYLKTSQ